MQIAVCNMDENEGLMLKNREGIVRISFAGLEYVEVINKTVIFHLADGSIREVTAALGDIEKKLLAREEFLKVHRSYLVNLKFIDAIDTNGIVTKNGRHIPVSRPRRSQVQDACLDFLHRGKAGTLEKPERADGAWRILIVDDEPSERAYWADILRAHGCVVRLAGNGEEAFKLVGDEPYDCVLLDVMFPEEDGLVICEKLHKLTSAPIIFLSCVTESDKQVEGFAAGGVDYITKNTSAELFWAKVETRIRLSASGRTAFFFDPLCLDLTRRSVLVDGKKLMLTAVEFDILWRLSEQAGHVFTVKEIFDAIWDGQPWDGGQAVQMHMSRLRRKLEKAWDKHHFIETVWGEGYRFVPADSQTDTE